MIGAPFKEASTVGFSTIQGEEFYEQWTPTYSTLKSHELHICLTNNCNQEKWKE